MEKSVESNSTNVKPKSVTDFRNDVALPSVSAFHPVVKKGSNSSKLPYEPLMTSKAVTMKGIAKLKCSYEISLWLQRVLHIEIRTFRVLI
jgi:hypothetical protein